MSLGIPEIIFNAAEPIPDFFQELNTKLPQPARVSKNRVFIRSEKSLIDVFSIQYKTRVSLGVPGIILNAAEPIPDFFQELSTELPQP